jgi:hypothetical protein
MHLSANNWSVSLRLKGSCLLKTVMSLLEHCSYVTFVEQPCNSRVGLNLVGLKVVMESLVKGHMVVQRGSLTAIGVPH